MSFYVQVLMRKFVKTDLKQCYIDFTFDSLSYRYFTWMSDESQWGLLETESIKKNKNYLKD